MSDYTGLYIVIGMALGAIVLAALGGLVTLKLLGKKNKDRADD